MVLLSSSFVVAVVVSTCGRWSGSRGCPLLSCRVPCLLSAFLLCLWWVTCKYGSIWRFKGVFSVVWGVRVGLCGLRALRGLWGFCAHVWLGGLEARGVFASVFILLCLCFSSLPVFWGFAFVVLCLFSCLPCLFLCGCCCFLFPFGICAKREGAKCFLRPLSVYCRLVISL